MIKVEISPGGVGFIRTPVVGVPGIPAGARQAWVNGADDTAPAAPVTTRRSLRAIEHGI